MMVSPSRLADILAHDSDDEVGKRLTAFKVISSYVYHPRTYWIEC